MWWDIGPGYVGDEIYEDELCRDEWVMWRIGL